MSENICPACRKTYSNKPTRCICGWYLTKESAIKIDRSKCHYFVNGVQCNQHGTRTIGRWGKDWFCEKHERELREKSYQF